MPTLEKILSQAVITSDAIRDRVTGKAAAVLGRSGGASVQITAVGVFSEPWANDAAEIAAIRKPDTWSPSTIDFIAVAVNSRSARSRVVREVDATESFLHLILDQKPNSIGRINLITHGNTSSIALSGEVISGNVLFDDELDIGVLAGYLQTGIPYKGRTLDWTELENRFADNAVLVVYACKAGLSESFVQDLADFFDIRVQGFKHELKYVYPENALAGGVIRRNLITVDGVKDFLDLVPEIDKSPSLKNPFK